MLPVDLYNNIDALHTFNVCMSELEVKAWSYEMFIDEHEFHDLPLIEYIVWGEWYEMRFNNDILSNFTPTLTPPSSPRFHLCAPAG
jgi:hypothetical protein